LASRIDLAICPNITTTSHPGPFEPRPAGCGPAVFSAGMTIIGPGNGACETAPSTTDLGTFPTTQNPLGALVHAGGLNNCATNPPTLGPGAGQGTAFTLRVAQTGFCPTTLTVQAQGGPFGDVLFSIGSLPFGSYDVTVSFPEQTVFDPQAQRSTSWIESHASGTLHVGTNFTETDTNALVRPGKSNTFAVLLNNSVAGLGAGQLVSTNTGNPSIAHVTGTDYYSCGTIEIEANVKYGRRGANGVSRLTGDGSLTGGTGNYKGIKGAFTVTGSYDKKTNRGTLKLTGAATY
jgi:hypothetical protein